MVHMQAKYLAAEHHSPCYLDSMLRKQFWDEQKLLEQSSPEKNSVPRSTVHFPLDQILSMNEITCNLKLDCYLSCLRPLRYTLFCDKILNQQHRLAQLADFCT